MAALVLSVAGAAVGSFFGAPQIGWIVGSTIGGLVAGSKDIKNEGPRLNDLSVQASQYGVVIPRVWGQYKVNGNVIDCPGLNEVVTTTEQDGKGGPTVTSTTYTYNCDIAILLCNNEIAGIRKIFSSGKLIYDASSDADIETVLASDIRATGMKVYLGTETQMPDPTLEAIWGVGNVPAYRGCAYVVFSELDCPGGQIPQLSFEVLERATTDGSNVYGDTAIFSNPSTALVDRVTYAPTDSSAAVVMVTTYASPVTSKFYKLGANFGYLNGTNAISRRTIFSPSIKGIADRPIFCTLNRESFAAPFEVIVFNGDGDVERLITTSIYLSPTENVIFSAYGDYIVFTKDGVTEIFDGTRSTAVQSGSNMQSILLTGMYCWYIFNNGFGTVSVQIRNIVDLTLVNTVSLSSYFSGASVIGFCVSESGDSILALKRTTGSLLLFLAEIDAAGNIEIIESNGNNYPSELLNVTNNPFSYRNGKIYGVVTANSIASGVNSVSAKTYVYSFASLLPTPAPLSDVITDICQMGGVDVADIDVSALSGSVDGYALTNLSTARANIDPLLKAFFIDPLKSDGKLKFRPRSGLSAVTTIAFDELGSAESGSDLSESFPLTRTQEDDLPLSLAVTYINATADYQNATETARRIITHSTNDQSIQMPVVMTSDKAASVANALLYDAWAERNKRSLKTGRRFAALDAGDVVNIEYPLGTTGPYRITRSSDTGVICEFDVVEHDGPIYTVQALGSPATGQDGVLLISASRVTLLDIPILRDADDDAGLYAAMTATATSWPGASLYVGLEDTSLSPAGTVTGSAIVGSADTLLGDWTDGTLDEKNTVDVTVQGELFNSSRDSTLTSSVNAAVIGDEVLTFTTATLIGGTQYRLSGLHRGMRGTEWARSTHAIGDKFVLLEASSLLRPQYDVASLNSPRRFRPVTIGRPINSAESQSFTNTGVGLKPFSPAMARAFVRTDGVYLEWCRRTRYSENFLNGVVPLGEASEAYEVDIEDGSGNLIRTITSSTTSILYTRAQQFEDNAPSSIVFKIYQIGSDIGRGISTTVTSPSGFVFFAQINKLTLAGTFTVGNQIRVVAGALDVTYTVVSGDTNLAGVAISLAAAINTAAAVNISAYPYSASASGPDVTVTGLNNVAFTFFAETKKSVINSLKLVQAPDTAREATRGEFVFSSMGFTTSYIEDVSFLWRRGTIFYLNVTGPFPRRYGYQLPPDLVYANYTVQLDYIYTGLKNAFNATSDAAIYDFQVTYTPISASYPTPIFTFKSPLGVQGYAANITTEGANPEGPTTIPLKSATFAVSGVPVSLPMIISATIGGTPSTGQVFTITLGGVAYNYTVLIGDGPQQIANGLSALIDAAAEYTATTPVLAAPSLTDYTFQIARVFTGVSFSYASSIASSDISVSYVTLQIAG